MTFYSTVGWVVWVIELFCCRFCWTTSVTRRSTTSSYLTSRSTKILFSHRTKHISTLSPTVRYEGFRFGTKSVYPLLWKIILIIDLNASHHLYNIPCCGEPEHFFSKMWNLDVKQCCIVPVKLSKLVIVLRSLHVTQLSWFMGHHMSFVVFCSCTGCLHQTVADTERVMTVLLLQVHSVVGALF